MLLLVAVALIGAVASEPQGVIPMGYNIVAPNVAPSVFPISYSTIPAATVPSGIPAVIPATLSGPIPAESVPASTFPLGSIPTAAIPMGSFPAAAIPMGTIPAAGIPAATIPAAPGVIQMGQNIVYPSSDVNTASPSSVPKPVEDTPEVKKARMDFETAYNKALNGNQESTSVFRAKRDLQRVLPYGYNLPYSGYVTPYGQISGAVPSSHVIPSNVLHSPYANVLSSNVIPSNVIPSNVLHAQYYHHV
uniref:RNA-binding protein 12 n=1 Tax=Lygus hesperus TaxID=30085 RepID=A0A0A9WDG2_LYGHE